MHSEGTTVPEARSSIPRILFIDAYDSFSNNIIALLQEHIGAEVTCIHIDDPAYQADDDFHKFLDCFDAVVAGPGPGSVTNNQDVGLIARLWIVPEEHRIPVLGICLGFQSLALAFGAKEEKLTEPRHGIITRVQHDGSSLFRNLGTVFATQYHSLTVRLQSGSRLCAPYWTPTPECPELVPLAWDCDCPCNGPVLMALRHTSLPFWGVQYHPESICTSSEGAAIVGNWWAETCAWSARAKRASTKDERRHHTKHTSPFTHNGTFKLIPTLASQKEGSFNILQEGISHDRRVLSQTFEIEDIDIKEICELLGLPRDDTVILESGVNRSGQPVRAETGSCSIIGCPPDTGHGRRLEYHLSDQAVEVWEGGVLLVRQKAVDIWAFLQDFTEHSRFTDGPAEMPFWGGLVGYVSYEAGLTTIDVAGAHTDPQKRQPDICFAFIMRSIVVDHARRRVCVQSIMEDDWAWVQKTTTLLQSNAETISNKAQRSIIPSVPPSLDIASSLTTIDTATSYESKVRSCQSSIRAGDSYEMCLTYQNHLKLPIHPSSPLTPWLLYTRLRKLNPAPFGAYMRLGAPARAVNIVSSSPERFLSWSRVGKCQYRPIKGTVKKEPGVTRKMAEEILNSSKERAENLMIVDLVRHDLHGVVGTGNVRVTKLMGVEEYETVWQLVSVIEGDLTGRWAREAQQQKQQSSSTHFPATKGLAAESESGTESASSSAPGTPDPSPPYRVQQTNSSNNPHASPNITEPPHTPISGISILASSLPPGSMTGAPKKRSCELLQSVERHQPRGIYSGVLGYLDVGGGGDFAVVIRTAFKWDDDVEEVDSDGVKRKYETWRVGAGGAVTGLSSPRGEYEEMRAKLESTMRMFGQD